MPPSPSPPPPPQMPVAMGERGAGGNTHPLLLSPPVHSPCRCPPRPSPYPPTLMVCAHSLASPSPPSLPRGQSSWLLPLPFNTAADVVGFVESANQRLRCGGTAGAVVGGGCVAPPPSTHRLAVAGPSSALHQNPTPEQWRRRCRNLCRHDLHRCRRRRRRPRRSKTRLPPPHHLPACISGFFGEKKNTKCSLPATNHQNTTRINLFCLPSNEKTLMRMVAMVAIRPIWLLWSAKL